VSTRKISGRCGVGVPLAVFRHEMLNIQSRGLPAWPRESAWSLLHFRPLSSTFVGILIPRCRCTSIVDYRDGSSSHRTDKLGGGGGGGGGGGPLGSSI